MAIAAIVFATQVNAKIATGDISGAVDSSKKAKAFSFIAIGLGLALWLIYGILYLNGDPANTGTNSHTRNDRVGLNLLKYRVFESVGGRCLQVFLVPID